ncbi:MAG TPA: tetratricopeptide repeat protein [Pyrinomonadaceae bacterium]|jgi:serine/threonine-protein kinase
MIGRTISHYRILSQLGEGGMGVVYVAEDMHLGRRVAVKLPMASDGENQYRSRFLREARAISALSHKNIAAVYDYGETPEGQPFIVMELVNGRNLSELLHASELTIARAVEIVADVAEALNEAHRHGIIHRDIKPSNVIINERGEVKVLDFGLAKQLHEQNGDATSPEAQTLISTRTRSDVVIGTPLYLSPEQARGAPVDRRSDLFTLGALLYECIAGRPAFSGANIIEIGGQVLHVDPPPPSQFNPRIPAELDRITLKALAKKPENRYQSADEFCDDLRLVLAGFSGVDTSRIRRLTSAHEANGRSSMLLTISDSLRRPRISPIAFIGALVAVLLGGWGVMSLFKPTPPEPDPVAVKWYVKGTNFMRDGAYDQARRALQEAVKADPQFALAAAALAEAWMELDYVDKANGELVKVASLVPDRSVLPELDRLYLEAIHSTAVQDFPRALSFYEQIAKLKPNEPQVYVDLGRAYEKTEETQKAIENYLKAIQRDPQYATAFLRLGILYGRKADLDGALSSFERADQLYQALGNTEGRAEVLLRRGSLYKDTGKHPDKARNDLRQALDMARTSGNEYQRIQALLALSNLALADNQKYEEAETHAREAIGLAQSNGMYNLHARGLVDLGSIFFTRGEFAEAEKYFVEARDVAEKNKVRRGEARALFALASLLIHLSKTDEGMEILERGLKYYEKGGFTRETLQARTLLGRAHRQKGDYQAALKIFEQELKDARQMDYPIWVGMTHNDLGRVFVLQERYPEALTHFQEGYAISKLQKNPRDIAYGLLYRSTALSRLGRFKEAADLLAEASGIAESGGYKPVLAGIYQVKAEMALAQRQFPQALSLAGQAHEFAGARAPEAIIDASRVRALALVATGQKPQARQACEEALSAATQAADPGLRSQALLTLSEVLLESDDYEGALARALEAEEFFRRSEQYASAWHALLLASRASRRLNQQTRASDYSARALSLLSALEQRWGSENYQSYLARPDVQLSHQQLQEL